MRWKKRFVSLLLVLAVLTGMSATALAAVSDDALSAAVADTAEYLLKTVNKAQVGSTGGEWAVLGLARSGCAVPEEFFQDYCAAAEEYVKACKGVLHGSKYTEYSRVILALSAVGRDARDVAGYDLTTALGDYDKTVRQGINGPVWALIALDSREYPMPVNPEAGTQATRQMYVERILSRQLADGGWSLSGTGGADADVTGMALQALAKYTQQDAVREAVDAGLSCLSAMQDENGGFASWGAANAESCAQAIVALCELGVPLEDARFVKGGKSLLDGLMGFYTEGKGFRHTADGEDGNQMASEQGLYALAAVQRARQGKNSLYRMGDAVSLPNGGAPGAGLPGKHADVRAVPVISPGMSFGDVSGADRAAIEALASRGVIGGMGDGLFHPGESMTRAQFAAITVRALGLTPRENDSFSDVRADAWYAAYVGAASDYGIITGVGEGRFNPDGTITKQEAAVMAARAARLCGMDTGLDAAAARGVLSRFADLEKTPEWARQGLAFCYGQGILDGGGTLIDGSALVRRCEVAQMLFRLLDGAKLL